MNWFEVRPMAKRHIIIGDVHGMLSELEALLADVEPSADDVVIFVGDLLDKGPDVMGVIAAVRGLSKVCKVVLVEGNHEEKHRRWRKHAKVEAESGKANPMSDPRDEYASLSALLSDEDVEFLESAVLFHKVPEHNVLVVHGGVSPSMSELPDVAPRFMDLKGKAKKSLGPLLRMRFVDKDSGKMLALGNQKPDDPFWADIYDGRFGLVVFGHEAFDDAPVPAKFPHALGIDLGAALGGWLAALVLNEDGSQDFVTVKAVKAYAERHGGEALHRQG